MTDDAKQAPKPYDRNADIPDELPPLEYDPADLRTREEVIAAAHDFYNRLKAQHDAYPEAYRLTVAEFKANNWGIAGTFAFLNGCTRRQNEIAGCTHPRQDMHAWGALFCEFIAQNFPLPLSGTPADATPNGEAPE